MKRGFTLIELIMVVALIAIVSTLAVTHMGSLRDETARRVSAAGQQAVGRAVEVWLNGPGRGRLDRLDSLLTYERARGASAGAGFDYGLTNAAGRASSWLYAGVDSPVDAECEANAGLTPELRGVLVPYGLDAREAAALTRRLGLRFVLHHLAGAHGPAEGDRGEDGVVLRDVAARRLDPERSALWAQSVTNAAGAGCYVAAVTPATTAGRRIYRDCGQDLPDSDVNGSYDGADAAREAQATGGVLLAFGLGAEASLAGAAGGLEAVPRSEYPPARHYRNYVLLFRVRRDASGTPEPAFAGVLDPCGQTIRQARQDLK